MRTDNSIGKTKINRNYNSIRIVMGPSRSFPAEWLFHIRKSRVSLSWNVVPVEPNAFALASPCLRCDCCTYRKIADLFFVEDLCLMTATDEALRGS